MFDPIDTLVTDLFEKHIDNYDDLQQQISWTRPEAYKHCKRDLDRVVSIYESSTESDNAYIKDKIVECLLLLNDNGIKVYLDKIEERLKWENQEVATESIVNVFIKGRKIQPVSEKTEFCAGVTYTIPTYSFDNLDFDIDKYTALLVEFRLRFISTLLEVVSQLRNQYATGKATKEEDIVIVKPTLWGLSIDFNKLYRKYIKRKTA